MTKLDSFRTRSGYMCNYAHDRRQDLTYGISIDLDDTVPERVRIANTKHKTAIHNRELAEAEVGTLVRQLDAAKKAHLDSMAQAIADEQVEPTDTDTDKLRHQVTKAKAQAEATARACGITEARLSVALHEAQADGSLQAAAETISNRADGHLTRSRELLAQARTERDHAAKDRALARWLDAFPAPSGDVSNTPTQDADMWRVANNYIDADYLYLEESVPLSVLKKRPDLQQARQHTPTSEATFDNIQ